jgi:hypothetical protein
MIEKDTCVRFVKYDSRLPLHVDHIEIINDGPGACWSGVGKNGGKQELSLGDGCIYDNVLVHEAIHAIGFMHTQNRFDRDNYIRILWENVEPGSEYIFDKVDPTEFTDFGTPYELK